MFGSWEWEVEERRLVHHRPAEVADLWAQERTEIALRTTVFPQFVIHAGQRLARDDSHGNLVGEPLRLEIWMVREDPHVPQLVRHSRIELLGTQSREKAILNRETKRFTTLRRRLDGHNQRNLRLDRNTHALAYAQLVAQSVDHQLNPLEQERRRLCWRSGDQTRHGQDQPACG